MLVGFFKIMGSTEGGIGGIDSVDGFLWTLSAFFFLLGCGSIDYLLKNPDYMPNCSVSVLVTCGPNMDSWQGSIFGFSNTIIGVTAFVAPIAVGVALLAGARFAPWFWWLYELGLLFGFGLILWLASQSIFMLSTLCPWCMVVWSVMIPLWWIGALRPHAVGDVPHTKRVQRAFAVLYSWSWVLILVTYVLIALVAQVQLDWFGEFRRQ